MQRPDTTRSQRTQPALPGVTLPTVPAAAQRSRGNFTLQATVTKGKQKARLGRAVLFCLLCGLLLEVALLSLYPILANLARSTDPLLTALSAFWPGLPMLYWTHRLPALVQVLSGTPWLSPLTTTGNLNLAIGELLFAAGCMVLAALACRRVVMERLSLLGELTLFWTMLLFTLLFSLTLLLLPSSVNQLSQNLSLYGFYGRVIVVYHANPYVGSNIAALSHDLLQPLLGVFHPNTAPYGPIWLDLCILVTLLAGKSLVSMVIGFRLLGLCAHAASSILLWLILKRFRPRMRAIGTLLYAWNPLVLLFSIGLMQQEAVIVFGLLLAIFFLQRESPTLGWVCALLVVLVNPFYALLLPIVFRMLLRESRILYLGRRFLWWLGMICVTVLIVALAYAPYWQSDALAGIWSAYKQVFLPDVALNSLDAALLHLPVTLPPTLLWVLAPHHWAAFALVIEGLLILLGLWLADTLGLVLLFSSWLLLCGVALMPIYWPWYLLPALALTLSFAHARTLTLMLMLEVGAFISMYGLLGAAPGLGQGLVTLGLPLLLWGWLLFFSSTWQMAHANVPEPPQEQRRAMPSFSRPSWMSRPSRPGR